MERTDSFYLKIIGGLGSLVFVLGSLIANLYLSALTAKYDGLKEKYEDLKAQVARQWDTGMQRGERVNALDSRLTLTDANATQALKELSEIQKDVQRIKFKLHVE